MYVPQVQDRENAMRLLEEAHEWFSGHKRQLRRGMSRTVLDAAGALNLARSESGLFRPRGRHKIRRRLSRCVANLAM